MDCQLTKVRFWTLIRLLLLILKCQAYVVHTMFKYIQRILVGNVDVVIFQIHSGSIFVVHVTPVYWQTYVCDARSIIALKCANCSLMIELLSKQNESLLNRDQTYVLNDNRSFAKGNALAISISKRKICTRTCQLRGHVFACIMIFYLKKKSISHSNMNRKREQYSKLFCYCKVKSYLDSG